MDMVLERVALRGCGRRARVAWRAVLAAENDSRARGASREKVTPAASEAALPGLGLRPPAGDSARACARISAAE